MGDWPHQIYAVDQARACIEGGVRRSCITSPTGGGKSKIMQRIIEWGYPTAVYANRTMLIEQLSEGLTEVGIPHGIQASGYAEESQHNVQVCSIQTVGPRWKKEQMVLHPAKIVLVDEGHNEKGWRLEEIINEHLAQGAFVIYFTATPVGMSHMVDKLIVAGSNSELRKCGALIPAETFAPDEPSMAVFKSRAKTVLQIKDELREVYLPAVVGRIVKHIPLHNPDRKPGMVFGPDVAASRWIAEKLTRAGYPAAHIDAKKIWLNGEDMPANTANRRRLKEAAEAGEVTYICNRFVLREGINLPFMYHGILACTFGGVCSYLQAGGRLLRNHPSLDHVRITDHGGNYWRHGSLNEDREWVLDKEEKDYANERAEANREYNKTKGEEGEPEPIVCPKCSKCRAGGVQCPSCGHTSKGKTRFVIEVDGTLRAVRGDINRPRRESKNPAEVKDWVSTYFRCLKSGKTFSQARGLYAYEHKGEYPSSEWPYMPMHRMDWTQKVKDVPRSRLVPEPTS